MRTEAEVFAELSDLCTSDGYVHAVAYLSFRDNIVSYSGDLTASDVAHLFSPERLVRTEVATLVGLMVKKPLSFGMPRRDVMQSYLDRTEALLKELHEILLSPVHERMAGLASGTARGEPFWSGPLLREAMFYGPESAYSSQYREFALRKYRRDDDWLKQNKGFSIDAAVSVARAVGQLQQRKMRDQLEAMQRLHPDRWTILPAFTVSAREVSSECGVEIDAVRAVLSAFATSWDERNETFRSLHDFNVTTATPLIPVDADNFALFQLYSLLEALYESPFYWMAGDKEYCPTAMKNRGAITEEFCRERLAFVFGTRHVHQNVRILESKDATVGEIDVLVLFGNRALVLQAKSKRLTLEARKGNDQQLKSDFKKSVQDSYEQGLLCAKSLKDPDLRFEDAEGRAVSVPRGLKEVYVLCVVSDHYPALFVQAREFLQYERDNVIKPPFVLDLFTLDAITEMLQSPLRLLSYVNRRALYAEKILATHELMVLAYHLKKNLWVDDELAGVYLSDDVSVDLDVAMAVRRDGLPGADTPPGILTRLQSSAVGRIIAEIESQPNPATIELGFLLLSLNEETVEEISSFIDRLAAAAARDGNNHDLTLTFDNAKTGLCVHCNAESLQRAAPRLEGHCTLRKYAQKAASWHGLCVTPRDGAVRFGVFLEFPWSFDPRLAEAAQQLRPATTMVSGSPNRPKRVGRNDRCPCGSGLKFKKCCGR